MLHNTNFNLTEKSTDDAGASATDGLCALCLAIICVMCGNVKRFHLAVAIWFLCMVIASIEFNLVESSSSHHFIIPSHNTSLNQSDWCSMFMSFFCFICQLLYSLLYFRRLFFDHWKSIRIKFYTYHHIYCRYIQGGLIYKEAVWNSCKGIESSWCYNIDRYQLKWVLMSIDGHSLGQVIEHLFYDARVPSSNPVSGYQDFFLALKVFEMHPVRFSALDFTGHETDI